ncbi:MAG TPA: ATP synthase F1 subunit epsilon [Candidatus Avacidaminococcus intestinavium]|uniref:ATP synthase epsilon chain n=1 Tax=Candidatus Avacidaminococcus intestinavium TaxID=2840684 RepID=A0A9D1SM20_9FIRM|nr:ATP synthase F1 subunit epsilon [Candidatus Avacidaminococcus intestinavium]
MAKLMQLEIVTPDKSLLKRDDVAYVYAETVVGPIGILPNHAPLIGTLAESPLKYRSEDNKEHYLFIDGGFVEISNNKVIILSAVAEMAENIDLARAEAAEARALGHIENPEPTIDLEIIGQNLKRAKGRIRTVKLARG